jgi:P27 family predicted phage terminase small subunit
MEGRVDTYDPPKGFKSDQKRAWWQLVTLLRGRLAYVNPGALEIAAVQLARLRQARRLIDKEGLMSLGSKQQPVKHPALAIERDAQTAFLRASRELGLDSKSVERLEKPDRSLSTLAEMYEKLGPNPMEVPPQPEDFELGGE